MINTIKATINLTNVCLDEVDLGNGVIYRGDDLATTLEIKAPINSNAYVLLACITPNGRNLGPFNADDTTSSSTATTYEFLLTKENGYNFAVGRTELIVYYCVVNTNSSISKKAIGSICVDVKKGVSVDDEATFIIGDTTDADAVLTDLNAKMDNLINQVASFSTQLSNKLDAVKNTVTLTNSGTLFTSRVESGTDSTIQSQGRNGISSAVDSSAANNNENRTAATTTLTITSKNSSNSTETKQTANYVTLKATDGTNTKTLAIAPQSININGKDVVVEDDLTAETTARQDADTNLQNQITQLGLDLDAEEDARSNADTSLQSQIDAINAAQNLADIVADLTALNNYDTSVLEANDKVEVLSDSDHDYSATVYNWTGSAWQYIGKYGDSYSKAESDAKYVNLTGTQTISGSKTFTNNTDWNFGDSDIVDFNKFEYRFSHDTSFVSMQDGYYKTHCQKAENNPDDYVEQYVNGPNLYVRTEITNNGKTSQDYMSNTQREIYIVNDNGNNSMRVGNSYAYLDDHYENDNYSSLGQVGISNNKPYINWELTSKNNNSTSWQTMINFWYRGLHLYTANKNTYDYSEIELGDESIKLSVSNEDNSENNKTLELSMSNGLTLNGNKIIDTANASTELFMTDAEMDTLIGEVFN